MQVRFYVAKPPESGEEVATTIDISALGIGLAVRRPVEVGALVSLELLRKDGQAPLAVLAGVVRAVGPVDGQWTLGCHFVRELTDSELASAF
jgi:hypothetical protein